MSGQSPKPPETPSPTLGRQEEEGAYGARIDRLFRDAIRDLDQLKRASEKAK